MQKTGTRSRLIIGTLLVLATIAVYWQVARFDFVNYDDWNYITHNNNVRTGLSLDNIIWAFTRSHSGNWHPLTWISHQIDCSIYNLHPWGHHLTNVLFHTVNTLLLFLLLCKITGREWRSAFIAAVFALHPIHVESVAWAAERKDVLSTFFAILTMLAYVSYINKKSWRGYILVITAYALGLMSKSMLVSLPILLLLLDYWPLNRLDTKTTWRRLVFEKMPMFAMAAVTCVITIITQHKDGATSSMTVCPLGMRISNALVSYIMYIWKMICPRKLCVFYPYPGTSLSLWLIIASAIALIITTGYVIKLRRTHPYLVTGWLWYFISLIPVIGLVQVGAQGMADRYAYIPSIGFLIAFVWLISDILKKYNVRLQAIISIAVIIALGIGAWFQIGYWRNGYTLFQRALSCTNGNFQVSAYLFGEMLYNKRPDEAVELFRKALKTNPDLVDAHYGLGFALENQGKFSESVEEYRRALRIKPDFAAARNNLGAVLARMGQNDEAFQEISRAVHDDPSYSDAYHNLGALLLVKNETDKAIQQFQEAIRLNPEQDRSHARIAEILIKNGDLNGAYKHLKAALAIDPKAPKTNSTMGLLQMKMKNYDLACRYYSRAVRSAPNWPQAHYDLAIALYNKGDYEGAWREVKAYKDYGFEPAPEFIHSLSKLMPEPR